eukprot:15344389-Ditylum_brightwellii.AAC.1
MYVRENAFSAENAYSQASVVPDWARSDYRLLVQEQGKVHAIITSWFLSKMLGRSHVGLILQR